MTTDLKSWGQIKRILMQYGVKVQHIMEIKEWHDKCLDEQKKMIIEKIEKGELQQCDCCGKVKSGKFTCGTCEDCI